MARRVLPVTSRLVITVVEGVVMFEALLTLVFGLGLPLWLVTEELSLKAEGK